MFIWGVSAPQTVGSALEARAYFLLLRQKKVAKEKANPGCAVGYADSPALLEVGGGCGTRATPSDSPRPFSADFCVARRSTRVPKGGLDQAQCRLFGYCSQPEKTPKIEGSAASRTPAQSPSLPRRRESRQGMDSRLRGNDNPGVSARVVLPGPLRGAEQRRIGGGRRLALSEPQASFANRPPSRVAQGTGVAGTDPGVAFSLATFFWRSKRKYARQQGGTPSSLEATQLKPAPPVRISERAGPTISGNPSAATPKQIQIR